MQPTECSRDQNPRTAVWTSFERRLALWPKSLLFSMFLIQVGAVGWLDYITGLDFSVSLLYLIPIALTTWLAGRLMGVAVALVSTGAWLSADCLARSTYGHWFVPMWNTLTLAVSFLVVVALLASLREANLRLEETVARRTQALQAEIAGHRSAEENLHRALRDARETHAELQRTQFQLIEAAKMESVGRLAAGVAHEVRNPLMTLSLGADYFLTRKTENPDEAMLVQDMKEAVRRASSIINLLLDFSRPRPLQRSREDLNNVIENSLALVRQPLNKQHVQVVRELQAGLPTISLDRTRIEHVFVNLFVNAMQAMPSGGTLTVRTSLKSPAPKGGDSPGWITVEIDDTGYGISAENSARLFEPFFSTKPTGQGTGLGLAIVRKIMEIHGGAIDLANRNEGGARATLRFNTEPNDRQ